MEAIKFMQELGWTDSDTHPVNPTLASKGTSGADASSGVGPSKVFFLFFLLL